MDQTPAHTASTQASSASVEPGTLAANLASVEERILNAVARCGRTRGEIRLMAVTKVFPAQAILDAYALGLRDFGENYVQEFEGKHGAVAHLEGARFHFIGHLQSNKSRRAAEIFHTIQTVDSAKLARRLNEPGSPLDVMIEVKLSPEQSKAGAAPEELPALIEAIAQCPNLTLLGLMTMPPWDENPEAARPYFRELKQLADAHSLKHLSMGMSHDFEAAIEEGSTLIRVGTALFGRRVKK
ncbi:MAG: YggS family pyridoxal phosphate-dependent enzyme [Bryobacterales bacterium]|nr:YggS family pyridoxal phosphate-dependent enzyme [Bryobacterales bacterium]